MISPPWFFCCGWWSPWCLLDEFAHALTRTGAGPTLPGVLGLICRRHYAAIERHAIREERAGR